MKLKLDKNLYTTKELADLVGVTEQTLRLWVRFKGLKALKCKNKLLFLKKDIEDYFDGVTDEVRIKHMHFSITPSLHEFLEDKAKQSNISMNEYVNRLLEKEREKEKWN